jgi:hypothetical protein
MSGLDDEKEALLAAKAEGASQASSDEEADARRVAAIESGQKLDSSGGFSCETFLPCDPRRWLHRFLLLFLMCSLSFGSYYVYDNPAALEKTIINVMHVSVTQYALLYSLYSWPNVILSVFGGYLIDRVLGIRLGTIIFSSFVCAGQLVFAFGAFVDKYWLMLVGRFVFG